MTASAKYRAPAEGRIYILSNTILKRGAYHVACIFCFRDNGNAPSVHSYQPRTEFARQKDGQPDRGNQEALWN
jgi:hypothetical protein